MEQQKAQARIECLIEQIKKYHIQGDMPNMTETLRELETLSNMTRNLLGRTASNFYNAILDTRSGNFGGAIECAKMAIELGKSAQQPYYVMKGYNALGIIYSERSDFYISLTYYLEAYKIAEENPQFQYATVLYNNIGTLFVWLDESELALSYLKRAYDLYYVEQQEDMPLLCNLVLNIMELCFFIGDYEQMQHWRDIPDLEFSAQELEIREGLGMALEMMRCHESGNVGQLEILAEAFVPSIVPETDYVYIFRSSMAILKPLIENGLRRVADLFIMRMEQLNESSIISTFNYSFAELKAQYYQRFITQKDATADYYLGGCYREGQRIISQLKQAYSRSMAAEIELNRSQNANKEAVERANLLQKNIDLDAFTGLLNKVGMKKYVMGCLEATTGDRQALLIIDIDYFKNINDTYGHLVGDDVIMQVADLLREYCQANAVPGRFGGDEFVVYLTSLTGEEEIVSFAEQLVERAHGVRLPDQRIAQITMSIGICLVEGPADFKRVLSLADEALYDAKRQGRNRFLLRHYSAASPSKVADAKD